MSTQLNWPLSGIVQIRNSLATPILSPILGNRKLSFAIIGAGLVHTAAVMAGWSGWPCPVRDILGIPCPGCGLSRAIIALLHGDWETALILHAFAPLFLLALLFMAGATFLPATPRSWVVRQIERVERVSAVTAILLLSLVFYWLIRLLFFGEAYLNLITG